MITRIEVNNFQKFEHCVVELNKGINSFVGETNQGKTTLANRSINFVLFQTIVRDEYIRIGQKECWVKLTLLKDGVEHTIERWKTLKTSFFVIDGQKLEKSASGAGISLLKEFFNIDISNINILTQHDNHFFINLSPNQAGKELIDYYKMNSIMTVAESKKLEIRNIKSSLQKKLSAKESVQYWLDNNAEKYKEYKEFLDKCKKIEQYTKIIDTLNECLTLKKQLKTIKKSLDYYGKIKFVVMEIEKKLYTTSALNMYIAECHKLQKIKQDIAMKNNLLKIVEAANTNVKKINVLNSYISTKKTIADYLLNIEKHKEFLKGKQCPLCGNKINSGICND